MYTHDEICALDRKLRAPMKASGVATMSSQPKTDAQPAHTPGPWQLDAEWDRSDYLIRLPDDMYGNLGECIARVHKNGFDLAAQAEYARLIAAAPELLAALRDAHIAITSLLDERSGESHLSHGWRASLLRTQAVARAAIQRAGQS